MTYESAVQYIDEHIQLAVAALKPGNWILKTEDGILKDLIRTQYTYPSKKEAIEEFGARCCDSRRVPKVERIHAGYYWYYVKSDDGHDRSPAYIIRLTKANLAQYQKELKEQLDEIRDTEILPLLDNPLFTEDARAEAIQSLVRQEIYNEQEIPVTR